MGSQPPHGLSFGSKLTGLMALFVIAMVVVLFTAVRHATGRAAHARFVSESKDTMDGLSASIDNRIAEVQVDVRAAALDPIFRAQMSRLRQSDTDFGLGSESDSAEALADVHQILTSADIPYFARYDLFGVLDPRGRLVMVRGNPQLFGTNLSDLPLVAAARGAGGAAYGFFSGGAREPKLLGAEPSEAYLVLAQMVVAGGQTIGFVLVGERFSARIMPELVRISHSEPGIRIGDFVWLKRSSLTPQIRQAPLESGDESYVDHNGKRYLMVGFSAGDKGKISSEPRATIFFLRDISEEVQSLLSGVSWELLVLGTPIVLLMLAGSIWLARRMAAPLGQLTQEVEKVKAGNFSARMPLASSDEIGVLARAFNEMMEGLCAIRIDPLTGLYSEQYLRDTLGFEMMHSRASGKPLALLCIHIHGFEQIMEKHGEESARAVLLEAAQRLSGCKRQGDVLVRTQEDEFFCMLPEAGSDEALRTAESMVSELGSARVNPAGAELSLPICVGIAVLNQFIFDVEGFLTAARAAQKDANRQGAGKLTYALGSAEASAALH